jgi:hypothetical protein
MEKEAVIQKIEVIFNEFPDVGNDLSAALQDFQHSYRRKLAFQVDNYFVRAVLRKEYYKNAAHDALEDYALTLKELTKNWEGRNAQLPHLKAYHGMTRSYHFRVLCKKGLVTQHYRGAYRITENGWQVLERAYKISRLKPLEDDDYKNYLDVIR